MRFKLKEYILTTIVSVAIVVLSTIPIPENPPLGDVPLIDKWVHMVMYGSLSFVMWADRAVLGKRLIPRGYWWAMLLYPILLGGLMELVQAHLTTCRSGDWIDFEADAVGALIATVGLIYVDKIWREKISARK